MQIESLSNSPAFVPVQPPLQKLAYGRTDAAHVMSISVRSLDYLIASGEIPTRKVGARTLITHADIEKFFRRDHPTKVVQ